MQCQGRGMIDFLRGWCTKKDYTWVVIHILEEHSLLGKGERSITLPIEAFFAMHDQALHT